jgi:hypothetical protein
MPSDVSSALIRNRARGEWDRTIGPAPSSIATLSGFVRSVMVYLIKKAPRRRRSARGQSAGALWEDLLALMLFKVVTTETQLDINVDKIPNAPPIVTMKGGKLIANSRDLTFPFAAPDKRRPTPIDPHVAPLAGAPTCPPGCPSVDFHTPLTARHTHKAPCRSERWLRH